MDEPKLEHFGLTEAEYNQFEKRDFGKNATNIGCGLVLIIWLVFVATIIIKNKGLPSDWILILISIPGLLVPTVIVVAIITIIDELIFRIRNKNYRRYLEYVKAKKEYDIWWTKNQAQFWTMLSGKRFEQELGYLYSKLGYKVRFTPHSDDGGIDLILQKDNLKTIVQCKAHNKRIGPAVARELYGTLINSGADKAILATLHGVSSAAQIFINGKPISVITVKDIIQMRKRLDYKSKHNPN